jgi:hypothetical protein
MKRFLEVGRGVVGGVERDEDVSPRSRADERDTTDSVCSFSSDASSFLSCTDVRHISPCSCSVSLADSQLVSQPSSSAKPSSRIDLSCSPSSLVGLVIEQEPDSSLEVWTTTETPPTTLKPSRLSSWTGFLRTRRTTSPFRSPTWPEEWKGESGSVSSRSEEALRSFGLRSTICATRQICRSWICRKRSVLVAPRPLAVLRPVR